MALQVTDFGQWAEATSAPSIGSAFGSAFSFSGLYRFSTADGGTILGVGSSGTSQYIALAMLASGQGFLECSGGGTADAFAASNFSTGAWHSLVGVQSSSTSRVFYADGVAGTVNTTSANPVTAQLDRTTIGALLSSGNHISTAHGDIAECAIWDVALTAEEAAMLAAHVCPLLVRPARLVFYCPAQGTPSAEIDRVAGRVLTWGGTSGTVPVVVPHPAVLMPPTGPVVASQGTFPTITAPTDDFSVVESPLSLARGWAQHRYFAGPGSDMLQSDGAVAFSQQVPSGTFYSQVRDAVVGPDTEVGVRINAKAPDGSFVVGLLARLVNDGTLSVTGYGLYVHAEAGGDTWQLYRISGLTFDPLGAAAVQEVAVGDHVGFEVQGTSTVNLIAHHCPAGLDPAAAASWSPVVQRPDTSAFGSPLVTAGRTGLEAESSSGRFARWFDGTTTFGAVSLLRGIGDTVIVSDAVTGKVALARAIGDPVSVGDAVARGGVAQARALGDPVVVADAVSRGGLTAGRGLGDVVGSSDAVARGGVSGARVLSESVGVSDGVDRLLGAARAVAELVLVTDGVVGRSTDARALGDVVSASDAAPGRVLGLVRLVGDPVVVTDAVSRAAQGMSRALGDVVVVADAVSWPYVAPGDVLQLEVRVELTPALDTVVSVTPVIDAGVEVTA